MREFNRPPIVCPSCRVKIYAESARFRTRSGATAGTIFADWTEPPERLMRCPKCSALVDTSASYAYLEGFPPSFDSLKSLYEGFSPKWEAQRRSLEAWIEEGLAQYDVDDLEANLNSPEGLIWFRQRLVYRSATAFYRSLQLFLAYLTLTRHAYLTWSSVTAYYSRFYFLQAFLNLIGCVYFEVRPKDKATKSVLFFNGSSIQYRRLSDLPKGFRITSHEIWWSLMEALKRPAYPVDDLEFVLSRLDFDPSQRNRVNYGFEYHGGGFIELDWFDAGAVKMLEQMMPNPRPDRDITDFDRFFASMAGDEVNEGEFYGDEAQILWCSLVSYLDLLTKLGFSQTLVKTETIMALCDVHIGSEYPGLIRGIAQTVSGCLQDGFDLQTFMNHYSSSDRPEAIAHRGSFDWEEFFSKGKDAPGSTPFWSRKT